MRQTQAAARLREALRAANKWLFSKPTCGSVSNAGLPTIFSRAVHTASNQQAVCNLHRRFWECRNPMLLLGLAAAGLAVGTASAEERLNPEVLKDLAEDLISGQYADKERAVAMLSSMTMYIDHHDVLLESGVLPALLKTVSSSKIEPTVRVVALGCAADLFKSPDAQNYLASHPDFLHILVQCMQGEDRWDSGPEEGGLAKSHAARLLSELAGYERLHPLLIQTGAAQALAERGQELARLSAKQDRHYSSLGAVPGNNLELQAVDEERFTAAALFGLAGSQPGAQLLLQQDSPVLQGMVDWANSRDPILQRYGVGGVARAALSSNEGLQTVMGMGGFKALISALSEEDPQAQCFAAGAIGRISASGGQPGAELIRQGAPQALLSMLQPAPRTKTKGGKQVGSSSTGVRKGVHKCALRGLLTAMQNARSQDAVQKANGAAAIQAFLKSSADAELTDLANKIAQQLGAGS